MGTATFYRKLFLSESYFQEVFAAKFSASFSYTIANNTLRPQRQAPGLRHLRFSWFTKLSYFDFLSTFCLVLCWRWLVLTLCVFGFPRFLRGICVSCFVALFALRFFVQTKRCPKILKHLSVTSRRICLFEMFKFIFILHFISTVVVHIDESGLECSVIVARRMSKIQDNLACPDEGCVT